MAFPSRVRCRWESGVLGDPARAASHPADDRGAGYVRSIAALFGRWVRMESARRSGWRRQASAPAFPTLAMAGSSESGPAPGHAHESGYT